MKSKQFISGFLIFSIGILGISIMSAFFFDAGEIINGLKFGVFQIIGILIPGNSVLFLINKKKLSEIEFYIYSYIIGFAFTILIYFLTIPFQKSKYIIVYYIFLSGISFVYWGYKIFKSKTNFLIFRDYKGIKICVSLGAILLFIEIIMSCALHTLPLQQGNSFYQDYLFGIGNTIELGLEYPIVNFRAIFQGRYYYHYLYNIPLALMHVFLDIPAFNLTAFYGFIPIVIFLIGGSYIFFSTFLRNKACGTIIGMLLILFATGYETMSTVTYIAHMYMTPNNFDVALAFGMLLFAVIYKQTKSESFSACYFFIAMISFTFSFGSKAPLGIVPFIGCCVLGISYIFMKKDYKIILPYIITFFILEIGIYYFILSGNAEGTVSTSHDVVNNSIYFWGVMPQINEWLNGYSFEIPESVSKILIVVYMSLVSYYPIMILFVCSGIIYFIYWKKIKSVDISLVITVVSGMCIMGTFSHFGGSQSYFLAAALPYAVLLGIRAIYVLLQQHLRTIVRSFIYIFCTGLVAVGIYNTVFITDSRYTLQEFKRGCNFLIGNNVTLEKDDSWAANYVSPEEYEGYLWIRDNTPLNTVLLTDLSIAGYERYPYSPGVFTERHVYIPLEEDRNIIKKCYKGDLNSIQKMSENEGVEYIIQTKRVTSELLLPESCAQIVFENNGMIIYKLNFK